MWRRVVERLVPDVSIELKRQAEDVGLQQQLWDPQMSAIFRQFVPAECCHPCIVFGTSPFPFVAHEHRQQTFLPNTSAFPCQYHSTIAPYPFIHLPPTLYNVSLPVLQFSPVSTIPPLLHTHSFTYHPHYIMFLSQYFSFPLSVPFHQCSILTFIYVLL